MNINYEESKENSRNLLSTSIILKFSTIFWKIKFPFAFLPNNRLVKSYSNKTMTKPEIIQQLEAGFLNTTHTFQQTSEEKFFDKPASGKWTVAENLVHLIRAVKPLNQAFLLPTFAFRLLFGKPNRPSRSYEELVAKYHKKLAEGGSASGRFIPKVAQDDKKEHLIERFIEANNTFVKRVKTLKEEDLDRYLIPHPLLGKLTIREMLYFTIYHTQHHLLAVKGL